jgi:hypothetical protein
VVLGVVLGAVSVGTVLFRSNLGVSGAVLAVVGLLLFFVGLLVLITEVIETWLGRSQSKLVDGLQAG